MGFWINLTARILSAAFTIAIAKGVLLWLAKKQIYPDQWIASMIGSAENAVQVNQAVTWVLFGGLGFIGLLIGPSLYGWGIRVFGATQEHSSVPKDKQSEELEIIEDTVEPSLLISLTDLMREAEDQGWQFTVDGSQHIFDFARNLRDAGSTGSITLWGRRKLRIKDMTKKGALVEIDPNYWQVCKVDGMSCLKHSSNGESTGISSDNSQTGTECDENQYHLYADIHLNRKQAMRWLMGEEPWRISLTEFGEIAASKGWRLHEVDSGHIYDFVKGLQQAGIDSNVEIWGRRKSQSLFTKEYPLVKIQPEYWHGNMIDPHTCLHIGQGEDADGSTDYNLDIETMNTDPDHLGFAYVDIHVDRKQAISWLKSEGSSFMGKTDERLRRNEHGNR